MELKSLAIMEVLQYAGCSDTVSVADPNFPGFSPDL